MLQARKAVSAFVR